MSLKYKMLDLHVCISIKEVAFFSRSQRNKKNTYTPPLPLGFLLGLLVAKRKVEQSCLDSVVTLHV